MVHDPGGVYGLCRPRASVSPPTGLRRARLPPGARASAPVRVPDALVVFGITGDLAFKQIFPALYAMMAKRHMMEFGTTEEQMAMVAVKNHHNGACEITLYEKSTVQDVFKAFKIPEDIPKIILINGVQKSAADSLHDGDTLSVFPPIAGG